MLLLRGGVSRSLRPTWRVSSSEQEERSEGAMNEDHAGPHSAANKADMHSVRLRYGLNETDSWWHFALGPARNRIWQLHREMRIQIIRIFLFDKNAPDPLNEWDLFRSYVNAVLAVGATPMVTYAKFRRPFNDPRAVSWFAEQCGEMVWHCLEEWGEVCVRDRHCRFGNDRN